LLLFILSSFMSVLSLWTVFSGVLPGWFEAFPHLTTLVHTCGTLHWLLVQEHVLYRVSTFVWRCVIGAASVYLSELFVLISSCPGRQSLCSASRSDYVIPRSRTATKQHRAFSTTGPTIWDDFLLELHPLPHDLSGSKSVLFTWAWTGSASE